MKAISLWQPWASLIACGAKPYETRHWAPPCELIGQTIAIHAAKKIDRAAAEFAEELMYGQHEPGGFALADKLAASFKRAPDRLMGLFGHACLPIGCVVCTARLEAAYRLGEEMETRDGPASMIVQHLGSAPPFSALLHDDFGDYAQGRWAWLLTNVKPLTPPASALGRQGFFDLPQGWMCA